MTLHAIKRAQPITARCLIAVALATAGPAWAHTDLVESVPSDGQVLTASPTELRLRFSEVLEPRFSRVTLTGSQGQTMPASPLRLAADDERSAVVPIEALAPGRYGVQWSAMGRDGHRMKGRFTFSVQ